MRPLRDGDSAPGAGVRPSGDGPATRTAELPAGGPAATLSNAAERAYHAIRGRILDGRAAPGEPLREETLAAEIGVSRTPVRDALRRLLADGLVESARNYGTFVADLGDDEVLEVFELRAMLEGYAARRAALHVTEAELAELEQLADAMERIEQPGDGAEEARMERFAELNTAFHTVLVRASRSRRLEPLLTRMFRVPLVFLKRFKLHDWVNVARSNRQHREIIEALRSRNAEWAALAVTSHLTSTRPRLSGEAAVPDGVAARPDAGQGV